MRAERGRWGVLHVLKRLAGVSADGTAGGIEGLLSPCAFRHELARERARTDRGAPAFSMLALKIGAEPGSARHDRAARVLASLLRARIRLTDTAGWFDSRVGVIFPNTPGERVPHLWAPLEEAYRQSKQPERADEVPLPDVTYEVYIYPCDDKDKEPGHTPP